MMHASGDVNDVERPAMECGYGINVRQIIHENAILLQETQQ